MKKIYLSFDIEEFDMPKEYGFDIPQQKQIEVSKKGLKTILELLEKHGAKATFFSTATFAKQSKELIEQALKNGCEIASHTMEHSKFEISDLKESKITLETLFQTKVKGLRMPRMAKVSSKDVKEAGYCYNSSVNPIFLPGRYNSLGVSKKVFVEDELINIPAGVTPIFRIPLFWLSFHNFPLWVYKFLLKRTVEKRGYATLYFHPWEFTDLREKQYNFPFYVTKNTGEKMVERFEKLLVFIEKNKWETDLYVNLSENYIRK